MSMQRPVSQYLSSVALVVSLVAVAAGISFLTKRITEETFRVSVVHALSGKDKPAVVVKPIRPKGGSSMSYSRVFAVTYPGGKSATAFLVSVTGHSGPFSALYVARPGSEAVFSGLVGVAHPDETWRYGLTDRVIESWAERVTAVAGKYGEEK